MMDSTLALACQPQTFNPVIDGGSVLSLWASPVTNYSAVVPDTSRFIAPTVNLTNANWCNVTVEYTHPGQGDHVFVEAWLPMDGWNGRFQAVGGGGFVAGRFPLTYGLMLGAVADGFATISTEAGLGTNSTDPKWVLNSPGNANMNNINNFGSVALHDQARALPSPLQYRSNPGCPADMCVRRV